jgi:hypothetical protein
LFQPLQLILTGYSVSVGPLMLMCHNFSYTGCLQRCHYNELFYSSKTNCRERGFQRLIIIESRIIHLPFKGLQCCQKFSSNSIQDEPVRNGFSFPASTSTSEVTFEDLINEMTTRIMMPISSTKEITNMILHLIENFNKNPSIRHL